AGLGQGRVLGQEAVARVQRVRPGALRGLHDGLDVQVTLCRRGRANRIALVGHAYVERLCIGVRIDGCRHDAHGLAGRRHADGDLRAVGDQDFVKHGGLFSRNARMPSCPSGEARRVAIVSAVKTRAASRDMPGTSATRRLQARRAAGPQAVTAETTSCTAASRCAAGATWWTSPMRSARAASKRSAVTQRARAWPGPILRSTNGVTTAGAMPSRASLKAKS